MGIKKEREEFETFYKTKILTADHEIAMLDQLTEFHIETGLYEYAKMQTAWETWQAAKSQAVPEWKDYSQQSPRIDGRYQIFINGEQLAADWKSPFGFGDPIEGVAFIQELITHWAVLSADPANKAQEQN